MSRPTSGIDLRRIAGDERGDAILSIGILLPLLVALTFGILEFSLVMFDFHRAGEAVRRATRMAAIATAITDVGGLEAGTPIACTATGGTVSCGGGGTVDQAVFDAILASMQEVLPAIGADNVEIEYSHSGIGDATTPGGIMPLVSVRLIGVEHRFMVLDAVPGIAGSFTYPPFTTSYLAGGQGIPGS